MFDEKTAEGSDGKNSGAISTAVFAIALALAALLRFYWIEIKPLHHDEGVNSFFLLRLYREGHYEYNPKNYHGPTLYYFALVALYLFKQTELALRFWPAVFGLLSTGLLWPLRRWLGAIGTPVAALVLALSPGLVYFSRDFIHESSFGFFTMGMVASVWLYTATRRFVYLVLLAVSAGLLFATKETAMITAVVLVLAAVCAALWDIGRRMAMAHRFQLGSVWREMLSEWRDNWPSADSLLAALVIFIFVNVVFYSSFFTHWQGVIDAVRSIVGWTERGVTERDHMHAWHYYLGILAKLELPLLTGAVLGVVIALWRSTRFGLFLVAWSTGITLAYSLIPYKTPWLTVSMLLPLGMLSGYAAQQVFSLLRRTALRLVWVAGLLAALIPGARIAYRVNFDKYDDNKNSTGYLVGLGTRLRLTAYTNDQYGGYVYAQTDRDLLNLVRAIEEATTRMPLGKLAGIHITSLEYWPLPWYLRDYNVEAYPNPDKDHPGKVILPDVIPQPIVIASATQQAEVEPKLRLPYRSSIFTLRPGVELVLYVRDSGQ
jgi:uncharacterized protein (TIGR03663 family)